MKFRSKSAGYITGLKFYKGPQNAGVHTGRLWSSNGTLLASVKFENESESGWQSAKFSSPVAIDSNKIYIVSYHAPYGHYSRTVSGFRGPVPGNGPLQALRDGEDGPNGLYVYGFGFPTHSDAGSNYWVDPIFEYGPPATPVMEESQLAEVQSLPAPRSISCAPAVLHAGDEFECELRLAGPPLADDLPVGITSDSTHVRLPAKLVLRPNQRTYIFRGVVDEAAPLAAIRIAAGDGDGAVSDQIMVAPARAPGLSVPGEQHIRPGETLQFAVIPQGNGGLPVQILATQLPDGATFTPFDNWFTWTPTDGQVRDEEYVLEFNAASAEGKRSVITTKVHVDSGRPIHTGPSPLVCSPGALVSLHGRWLSQKREQFADPLGLSTELGGTRVLINSWALGSTQLRLAFVSQTRIDFICPSPAPREELNLVVETEAGATVPISMQIVEAKPALLTRQNAGGTGGVITHLRTGRLVTRRDHYGLGEPAQPDDVIVLWATGLGSLDLASRSLRIEIGEIPAEVVGVAPASDAAGIYHIHVRVPGAVPPGQAVPIRLELYSPTDGWVTSNTITGALEPVAP